MKNPENSADLPPEEAALENKLALLHPSELRPSLSEEILEPLSLSASRPDDDAVAQALAERLRPTQPSTDLWARIESQMMVEPLDESKVVSFPNWRDFAPVFKVAAVVAIGVLAAGVWLQPDQDQPSQTASVVDRPMASETFPITGKIEFVSRRGEIQRTERKGVVMKNEQFYESIRQLRRDHSVYHWGNDVQIEVEVSIERQMYTPLRTF